MFLDAIGEARDSVRRNTLRGIYDRVTWNAGQAGKEVEVLLLDERYERVPLPCHTRRRYCQPDIKKSRWHEARAVPSTALYCATVLRMHPNPMRMEDCVRQQAMYTRVVSMIAQP